MDFRLNDRLAPLFLLALTVAPSACDLASRAARSPEMPRLAAHGTATHLIVDGQPFLMRAGELGNSTASHLDTLRAYWPRLKALNLNTVLAPVYWELIEPAEGEFDFTTVDGLLSDARANGMRVVLLWFGSWKNSMSSYAPAWVKRDEARFPRARLTNGRPVEILSPFSANNRDADAKAFAALMRHVAQVDGRTRTIIMVQVENEIGMIPEARDHSPAADSAYRAEGGGDEERFMARAFARYTEAVAKAGKAEYALPMFVNAALARPGAKPGQYPSAGPLPHLFDIWKREAPSIDILAPDFYFPNMMEWARRYAVPGNPLLIPEIGRQGDAMAANALWAFGELNAMSFSPFSIEHFAEDDAIGKAYALIAQIEPLILTHQGDGTMRGARPPVDFDGTVHAEPQQLRFGDLTLTVRFVDPWTPPAAQRVQAHGGLIIHLGPEEFLIAGTGITVTFGADSGAVGFEHVIEGQYRDGAWAPGRWHNGDENHQGRHARIPPDAFTLLKVKVYRYR